MTNGNCENRESEEARRQENGGEEAHGEIRCQKACREKDRGEKAGRQEGRAEEDDGEEAGREEDGREEDNGEEAGRPQGARQEDRRQEGSGAEVEHRSSSRRQAFCRQDLGASRAGAQGQASACRESETAQARLNFPAAPRGAKG